MIEHVTNQAATSPCKLAPWMTPRVIVSDLGDARAQVDFGGDGSTPSYGPYGS